MNWLIAYRYELEMLGQVALAMLLGAVIGLEREFQDKPAGLRTHMLTTGSATLLVLLSGLIVENWAARFGTNVVDSDPLRSIGAVVTGISFLGAGTILRRGADGSRVGVEGLTTAASLLLAAAVGICVALSLWVAAVGTTVLALIVLRALSGIERWLEEQGHL
jgi:putative Mg2+ transporter-C (MgtC) family protein